MTVWPTDWLPVAIGVVAFLYAAVGHAGATGYIAVMTLAGSAAATVRPTALALNVIVAAIATVQFTRAGHLRGGLLLPLALASTPAAFVGGGLPLPMRDFEGLLGAILAFAAFRQLAEARRGEVPGPASTLPTLARSPSWPVLLALGALIGLLAGLTGVGGGVFLTPALLTLRVAPLKTVAAVTAPFILVNSLAGLAGQAVSAGIGLEGVSRPILLAAVVGGLLGSQAGAFQLPVRSVRTLLAVVLAIASVKLLAAVLIPTAG